MFCRTYWATGRPHPQTPPDALPLPLPRPLPPLLLETKREMRKSIMDFTCLWEYKNPGLPVPEKIRLNMRKSPLTCTSTPYS